MLPAMDLSKDDFYLWTTIHPDYGTFMNLEEMVVSHT